MSKFYNGIMGLVVGDALGVPVEFRKRDTYEVTDMIGFGTYNQKPGTWSDDSSLTLATVESMGRMGKVDPMDIMKNFLDWLEDGWFTPYGDVFDVGGATRRAITRFSKGTKPLDCGGKTRMDNGNGALMRILPVAMLPDNGDKQAKIQNVAHLTHAHFISDFACMIYTAIVENLMKGSPNDVAVLAGIQRYKEQLDNVSMLSEFGKLEQIEWLERTFVKSSGYVVDTLEAALWCFLNTETYRDCVLAAVNLGEDTDTVAAVAGGLAGIYYGVGGEAGIPESWIEQIARKDWIREICDAVQLGDVGSR
nr:MAG TPA: ADP-ribosylglycohydrolase [Caudoviricetes sp.]